MTIVLTTAGAAHITELEQGANPTANMFNGLVFSQGNDAPDVLDTLSSMSDRITDFVLRVEDGYPRKDDDDIRNTSRGPEAWTWKFVREAGKPFVASNFAVCNQSGGALQAGSDLAIHGRVTTAQRFDERRVFFLNVIGQEVRLVQVRETSTQNRVQRVAGFAANVRATASAPGGSVVTPNQVRTQASPGASIFTAAFVIRSDGHAAQPGDIVALDLTVQRYDASKAQFVDIAKESLPCYSHVFGAEQLNDPRWPHAGGYNVSYQWSQPRGTREGTFKLVYRMELCGDDFREWTNTVEVRRW